MRTILLLIPILILLGTGVIAIGRRAPSVQVALLTIAGAAFILAGLLGHRPIASLLGLSAVAAAEMLRVRGGRSLQ